MTTYILKRLLLMVPTFFGITVVTFLIIRLAPGDPVSLSMGIGGGEAGTSAGGGDAKQDRERQVVRAKVRLGLMEERGAARFWSVAIGREERCVDSIESGIRALAYSPDGAEWACGTTEGKIHIFAAGARSPRLTIAAHALAVNALDWSGDGGRIASASDDSTAKVWSVADGARIASCDGHRLLVSDVAFSPDGDRLATASRDRTVSLWSTSTGERLAELAAHEGEALAVLFTSDGKRLISGGRDLTVRAWSLDREPFESSILYRASATVHSLALDARSGLLAAGLSSAGIDLVDSATGRRVGALAGHTQSVVGLAFSPTGELLASSSLDRTVRLWDVAERRLRDHLIGHSGEVFAVAFRPDGAELASGALDTRETGLVTSYFVWLRRLLALDFGRSFLQDRPVAEMVLEALPVTLELNLISILIMYCLAIPLGVFSAAKRNTALDQTTTLGVFLLYSMPSFWVATMLIIWFGSPRGPLPFTNLHDPEAGSFAFLAYAWDHALHLVLPLTALTYASFAFLSRLVRSSMLEALSQDHVRTARAKGLSEPVVVGKHALRNSLIPVVTLLGNLLPAMIGGSVIIEQIYSVPGMGNLSFTAILGRDYPVIMAVTTIVAVLTMIGILVSDILYCIVDPRIELS